MSQSSSTAAAANKMKVPLPRRYILYLGKRVKKFEGQLIVEKLTHLEILDINNRAFRTLRLLKLLFVLLRNNRRVSTSHYRPQVLRRTLNRRHRLACRLLCREPRRKAEARLVALGLNNTAQVARVSLEEVALLCCPVRQNAVRNSGASVVEMKTKVVVKCTEICRIELSQRNELRVDALLNCTRWAVKVRDTTTHTSTCIATNITKNSYTTTSHVLEAVITSTLRHNNGARVTHTETFAGCTADKSATTSSTKEARVTHNYLFLGLSTSQECRRRAHDQMTSRETLAKKVIGITNNLDQHTGSQESACTLTCGTSQHNANCTFGETINTEATRYLKGKHSTHSTVDVENLKSNLHRAHLLEGRASLANDLHIKCLLQVVVLGNGLRHEDWLVRSNKGKRRVASNISSRNKDLAKVHKLSLVGTGDHLRVSLKHIRTANHLSHCANTHLRHVGSYLLSHHEQEVDHVLRFAEKLLA
mmetsp:Transcript_1742/g.4086  ORF Transcript_1742/g.4086 Transcript_1742/m.4086 type:complete len:476 (+) Transcript_1742:147-1574(+)